MRDFASFLLDSQVVDAGRLERVDADSTQTAEPLYYRLLRRYPELERPIWQALADFLELELVEPHRVEVDMALARIVPARVAHEYSIVPIRRHGSKLEVAMADPAQFQKCDEIAMLLSRQEHPAGDPLTVTGKLARPSAITEMIKAVYGIGADTVQDMLDKSKDEEVQVLGPEVVDLSAEEPSQEDAAIVRFVNQLLLEAVRIGASDIHLEPFERHLQLRYRLDGMLQTEPVPERIKHLEAAIISRIKIMANLDIAEKRLAQDGQIRMVVLGRPIDVRVSILPTIFGQGLQMRILDRQVAFRHLDNLGMPQDYLALYRKVLELSHGVILVTGPTGSGKTTTLYGSLSELNQTDRKIITVEDPIEYQLEGISQIQVKPTIGLTFANMLRSILRHDPDIIMVGEIRDRTTAEIAISAAMTGHLVLSTLHTNDAPSAPIRLLEMGIEPYLVSSALEAVLAQRLVRLLCRHCRVEGILSDVLPAEEKELLQGKSVYEAKGCPLCRGRGYQGRIGIFEMFTLNDQMRELIINRASAGQIRQAARAAGMRTLRQDGLEKVANQLSSLAEVYRVARDETIDMKKEMESAE